jgi:hypothetical protein
MTFPLDDADARLRDALDAVYRAFARRAPARIDGCPCCIGGRNVDILVSKPLRGLSGQELWRYVSGVFFTIGSEEDFRYLLPRILEISIDDPGNANDPEIVLAKIGMASWQSWSTDERRVIATFVDAWFQAALAHDLEVAADGWIGQDAESVLCGAARAGFDLAPWLELLQRPEASSVLADLKSRYPKRLSPFWEHAPEAFARLATILEATA